MNLRPEPIDPGPKKKVFSFRDLSVQLNLIVLGVSTIVLSLFAIYQVKVQTASLEKELAQSLKNESVQLSTSLSSALFNFDKPSVRAVCEAALQKPEILKIVVWDVDQKYVEIEDDQFKTHPLNNSIKTIEYPIAWGPEYLGKVKIFATMKILDEKIARFKKEGLVKVVALDLILGLVLMVVLGRKFVQPLQKLEKSSAQIAMGNLDYPIDVTRNDELGALAKNLKSMRDAVKEKVMSLESEVDRHHQTSMALKKSEAFLRLIIDIIPHRIFVKDKQGRFLVVNQAVAEYLGKDVEYITGKLHRDLARDSDDIDQMLKDDLQVIENGKVLNTITERHDSGRKKSTWLFTQKAPFQAPDGEKGVVGISMDISELKNAEIKLRQTNVFIDAIINSIPSVLFSLDLDTRITKWNRKAEQYYGISAQEAVSKPLVEVLPLFEQLMAKIIQSMEDASPYFFPQQARSGIRGTVFEKISVSPLVAEHLEGVVIRVDDVTDQVRMEEMVIQSEKMLSVGGLAAGMAHELNNPLAGMMQNAQVVLNRLKGNLPASKAAAENAGITMEQIRQFMEERNIIKQLDLIHESGVQASKVVQNMLSFSREDYSGKTMQDIPRLLDKTIEVAQNDYNLTHQYDFKKINIVRDYQDDLPEVMCEASKIQQVFFNILKNAAEAMHPPKTSQSPEFYLQVYYKDGFVVVKIKDNGPGMDEQERKRVFEPFFTTKPVDKGTGLGMSVSYFIIKENHGGEIEVTSEPDNGATFIIRLPVV